MPNQLPRIDEGEENDDDDDHDGDEKEDNDVETLERPSWHVPTIPKRTRDYLSLKQRWTVC